MPRSALEVFLPLFFSTLAGLEAFWVVFFEDLEPDWALLRDLPACALVSDWALEDLATVLPPLLLRVPDLSTPRPREARSERLTLPLREPETELCLRLTRLSVSLPYLARPLDLLYCWSTF